MMSDAPPSILPNATPASLAAAFAALQEARPGLRARDAASELRTTEAALLASGALGPVTALRPDWKALLAALPSLGRVMALTRNEHAVHECKGVYHPPQGNDRVLLVLGPDIDLRLFPGDWAHAYALRGERPSLQIFARDGSAVHKVHATGETDLAAWDAAVARLAGPGKAPPTAPAQPEAKAEQPVDGAALRADWLALRDTHEFFGLLRRHGASRRQAFRLAGEDLALRLPSSAGAEILRRAASSGMSIMVFVGNAHAIQIHTGPVRRVVESHGRFNILDPDFNLHLRESGVAEAWRVVKPTDDGPVTSVELLDAGGGTIAMLFGARKPGQPEQAEWRALVGTLVGTVAGEMAVP